MTRKLVATLAGIAFLGAPVLASPGFTASNLLRVNQVAGSTFEVVGKSGSGPGDYWCAASDYVLRTLTNSATQRIYVVRALGMSQTSGRKSAVQFSTVQPAGGPVNPSVSLTVDRVGENLNSASARAYCYDLKFLEP